MRQAGSCIIIFGRKMMKKGIYKILIIGCLTAIFVFYFYLLKYIMYFHINPISYSNVCDDYATDLNFSILDSLDSNAKERLFNYLSSSSEWKVERMYYSSWLGREGINQSGYIMARKRMKYERSHFNGPLIIFDRIENSYSKNYNFIEAENSPLTLKISQAKYLRPNFQDKEIEKSLRNIIMGNDLNVLIDIHRVLFAKKREINFITTSQDTLNLNTSMNEILKIIRLCRNIMSIEDVQELLEIHSYKNSDKNELNIKQEANYIKASGYVNTGRKGSVYLKIINSDLNQEISHPNVYNEEFVGWSEAGNVRFWFELNEQHIIFGEEGDVFDAECQLWFRPFDNTEEFMLASKKLKIEIGYRGF